MKQKFKLFLVVSVRPNHEGKAEFGLSRWNPDTGDIKYRTEAMVQQVEVEVDVPDTIDLNAVKLGVLEEALKNDRAESQARQNLLLDQISKLKCLGHDETLSK